MELGVLAVRYARALAEFSKESGEDVYSAVYEKFMLLNEVFREDPDLALAIEAPLLKESDKMALLITASSSGEEDEVLKKFFRLLILHRREAYLQSIIRCFIDIYRAEHNIIKARITTAVPLDEKIEQHLLTVASSALHKELDFEKSVDSKIEGGFILDVDNKRFDASVATYIKRIRKILLDKNKRIV